MGPSYHPSLFIKCNDITVISYHIIFIYEHDDTTFVSIITVTTVNTINIDNYIDNSNYNSILIDSKYNKILCEIYWIMCDGLCQA